MKCTSDEWDHCRVEKMGCSGCYYDKDTLEESINNLKKLVELRKNKCGKIKFDTCICGTKDLEIVLQALEDKEKIINEMAEYLAIIRDCPNEDKGANLDCENRCSNDDSIYAECWKLYFENKIKEE